MVISKAEIQRRIVLYSSFFDPNWYLENYPDVKEYPDGPLMHFVLFGEKEMRDPNEVFNTCWFTRQYEKNLSRRFSPVDFFLTQFETLDFNPNPFVSMKFVTESFGFNLKPKTLNEILRDKSIDYTAKWFSKIQYSSTKSILSDSPDLWRIAWQDLNRGTLVLPENFLLLTNLTDDLVGKGTVIDLVSTERETNYILQFSPGDEITLQLTKLAKIDGNVSVNGKKPFSSIRVFDAVDIKTRDNINIVEISSYLKSKYSDVFVISNLDRGGASTYLMEITSTANGISSGRILVIVTDMWKVDLLNYMAYFSNYRTDRIEFLCLRDVVNNSGRTHQILMQLIMILAPKRLWIMNSRIGYEIVSKYGQNIKNLGIKAFSFFFSEAEHYLSHSREWLGKVLPHSVIVSDNANYHLSVRNRVGDFSENFAVLRRPISVNNGLILNLSRNITLRKNSNAPFRVLWFGRWESKKDIWLFLEICEIFENVIFEQYGTLEEQVPSRLPSNLRMNGGVQNFEQIPVEKFDLLFFTSEFEGMPNTVLEAVAVGLPVVAARVGGLSEVFSDDSVFYYNNFSNASERIESAREVLEAAFSVSLETLDSYRMNALKDLEAFHSKAVIESELCELMEIQNND